MIFTLIFLFIIVIMFVLLNIAYKHTNRYKNEHSDILAIKLAEKSDTQYEIVVIGSSQAKYAYDFSDFEKKGVNLAARPQTLQLDSFILENIIKNIKPNSIIIISICLLEFFLLRFKENSSYCKYIPLLSKNQFKQLDAPNYFKAYISQLFPLLFAPKEVRYILRDARPKNTLDLDSNSCKTTEQLDKDAQYWINLWNNEFNIQIPNIFVPQNTLSNISLNVQILQKIIDICIDHSLKPIFVIPPVTRTLLSKFNVDFINRFLNNILNEGICRDVPILSYLNNEKLSDESFFINSLFLNKRGRKNFTKTLISQVKHLKK